MNLKEVKALSSKLKSTTLTDTEEISSDETSGDSSDETSSDESSDDEEEFQRHLKYLKRCPDEDSRKEIALSPIFTSAVRRYARDCEAADKNHEPVFPQHALLGCEADADPEVTDSRLYYVCAFPDDERATSCINCYN